MDISKDFPKVAETGCPCSSGEALNRPTASSAPTTFGSFTTDFNAATKIEIASLGSTSFGVYAMISMAGTNGTGLKVGTVQTYTDSNTTGGPSTFLGGCSYSGASVISSVTFYDISGSSFSAGSVRIFGGN